MTVAHPWWPFSRPEKEPVEQVADRLERAVAAQREATEELRHLIEDARESGHGDPPR